MKLSHILAAAALFMTVSSGAKALPVYSSTIDLGELGVGTYNNIANFVPGNFTPYSLSIFGSIPSNTMITFSYKFPDIVPNSALEVSMGSYDYKIGGDHYTGSAYANSGGYTDAKSFFNDVQTISPLVIASANIDNSGYMGTTIIKNLSGGLVEFESDFFAMLFKEGLVNVSATVSSVPLPAALPMFGLGLAGITALRSKKRKNIVKA